MAHKQTDRQTDRQTDKQRQTGNYKNYTKYNYEKMRSENTQTNTTAMSVVP